MECWAYKIQTHSYETFVANKIRAFIKQSVRWCSHWCLFWMSNRITRFLSDLKMIHFLFLSTQDDRLFKNADMENKWLTINYILYHLLFFNRYAVYWSLLKALLVFMGSVGLGYWFVGLRVTSCTDKGIVIVRQKWILEHLS